MAEDREMSRRKFLKSAGTGLATVGLGMTAGGSMAKAVMDSLKNRDRKNQITGMQAGGNTRRTNNPSGVPVPDIAKGLNIGAIHGIPKEKFASDPFHDIRNFGANTSKSDNSAAI